MKKYHPLAFAIIIIVIAALAGGFWGNRVQATSKPSADVNELLKIYSQVISIAEENYADQIDGQKTIYDSIRGMLKTLGSSLQFFRSQEFRAVP